MSVPLYIVDAFADGPFTGNPAPVCLFSYNDKPSDELLQKIAAELNLSVTAFVQLLSESDSYKTGSKFGLRWFSPKKELPLCGHATLASAATLFKAYDNPADVIEFVTRESGSFFCKKNGDFITTNLPLDAPQSVDTENYKKAAEIVASGHEIVTVETSGRLDVPLVRLADGMTREDFEKFQPDLTKLRQLEKGKWFIVTMKADPEKGFVDKDGTPYDFACRFFAPGYGINEDPVTGVAHTVLPSYWGRELNKTEMYARQCSKRGGDVRVIIQEERVELSGRGQVVVSGNLAY